MMQFIFIQTENDETSRNLENIFKKLEKLEEKTILQGEQMTNQDAKILKQEENIKNQDTTIKDQNEKIKNQDHKIKNQDEKIIRQEEEIKQLKTVLTTMQNNIQLKSNNSSHVFTDTYTWKVNQLREKMDRAKTGLDENPLTQSFYTSRGHKLEIQLWLNGKDDAMDKYVSIFFVAEEGTFDDMVKWPMRAIIKSYVNDNIFNEFNTTGAVASFQKPKNKRRFGHPMFISLDNIFKVAQNNLLVINISVTYL